MHVHRFNAASLKATSGTGDCYIAIFMGQPCTTAGGVYRISKEWRRKHYGGDFDTRGNCGTLVENFETKGLGAHKEFVKQFVAKQATINGPLGDAAFYEGV